MTAAFSTSTWFASWISSDSREGRTPFRHSAGKPPTSDRSILPSRTRTVPPTIAPAPTTCSHVGTSANVSQAMTSATTGMKLVYTAVRVLPM